MHVMPSARYCYRKLSLRLPSVTLVISGRTGWVTSKIITRIISRESFACYFHGFLVKILDLKCKQIVGIIFNAHCRRSSTLDQSHSVHKRGCMRSKSAHTESVFDVTALQ